MTSSIVTNFNKTFIWITSHNKSIMDIVNSSFTHRRNEIRDKDNATLLVFYTHTGYDEVRVYDEKNDYFDNNTNVKNDYVEIDYNFDLKKFVYVNEDEINKNSIYKDRWELMEESKNGAFRENSHLMRDF